MYPRMILRTATVLTALVIAAGATDARTVKWARSGDALTLDPHAQNEGPTHNLLQQIYEPLITRALDGSLVPTLATSWTITDDPTVWEFKLRQGVKFHNGNAFNADDVVFSLERALQPTSDMKSLITFIDKVIRVDDHTVHIKTKGPHPLVPIYLITLYMMDKEWSEANSTVNVQDYKAQKDNFAVRNANGTGPYVLVSREQDVKTVLKRNDAYWGKGTVPLHVTDVTYLTIRSDATRVAALLSGEVDLVQDVPVQDIDRLEKAGNLRVKVNLVAQPKGPHFTLLQKTPPESDFYLLGWGVPTFDSHYIFTFLYHSRSGKDGGWNATRYANPDMDKAIQSLTAEVDIKKRDTTIAKIWSTLSEETIYIALHHQMVAHAMKRDLDIPVRPDNWIYMKFTAPK